MRCYRARKRLSEADWDYEVFSRDTALMDHLSHCSKCAALVKAEKALRDDISRVGSTAPESQLSLADIKVKAETQSETFTNRKKSAFLLGRRSFRVWVVGVAVVVLLFIALVPFQYSEKVGYAISISGIDRSIAVDSKGIDHLLDNLGMERSKSTALLDSLDIKEIHLIVGECSETCHLKISELKSEKDVQLLIRAIIDLGCCEIDEVFPIFRNKSSSLLKQATQKLLS